MLAALLSQFANYDVITLGEAHGRGVDLELRLRLIQHPELPRELRVILAEFPDEQLTKAVGEANRRRAGLAPLRVVVSAPTSAAQIIVEHVRRGEKAILVYGAGHLWKREGGLTTALQASGARVLVVQTLAPPTPAAILTRLAASMEQSDFPRLSSLHDAAIGQTAAADVFPGEPLAPSLTLADIADMAVLFTGDRASQPSVSGSPSGPVSPNGSVVLSGRLAGLFQRPESRHVYLLLTVETQTGTTERWVVQGESPKQLTDWGWRFDAPQSVRLGEQIRVVAVVAPAATGRDQLAVDAPSQVIAGAERWATAGVWDRSNARRRTNSAIRYQAMTTNRRTACHQVNHDAANGPTAIDTRSSYHPVSRTRPSPTTQARVEAKGQAVAP